MKQDAKQVSVGFHRQCGIAKNGTLVCWGLHGLWDAKKAQGESGNKNGEGNAEYNEDELNKENEDINEEKEEIAQYEKEAEQQEQEEEEDNMLIVKKLMMSNDELRTDSEYQHGYFDQKGQFIKPNH